MSKKRTCPRCGAIHTRPRSYCRTCHNAVARAYRYRADRPCPKVACGNFCRVGRLYCAACDKERRRRAKTCTVPGCQRKSTGALCDSHARIKRQGKPLTTPIKVRAPYGSRKGVCPCGAPTKFYYCSACNAKIRRTARYMHRWGAPTPPTECVQCKTILDASERHGLHLCMGCRALRARAQVLAYAPTRRAAARKRLRQRNRPCANSGCLNMASRGTRQCTMHNRERARMSARAAALKKRVVVAYFAAARALGFSPTEKQQQDLARKTEGLNIGTA